MTELSINGRTIQTDLVIFDKDGTLIDFQHLWGPKNRLWIETMVQQVEEDQAILSLALYQGLGCNPTTFQVINDGPMAVASIPKLSIVAAAILYQHGLSWHDAEQLAQAALVDSLIKLPTADLIQPLGDVAGLCRKLTQSGIRVAIITSDNRAATEETLSLLGIEDDVSLLVCGDDEMPDKPAPDAIWHIGSQLGVESARIVMVGDTASDMLAGVNAGVGYCVGIKNGAGDQIELAAHADTLLESIDGIFVL